MINVKPNSSLEVSEMTRSNSVKMTTADKNGVADIMMLPKQAGEDLCLSPHKIDNMRYTLPRLYMMEDDDWADCLRYFENKAKKKGPYDYDNPDDTAKVKDTTKADDTAKATA